MTTGSDEAGATTWAAIFERGAAFDADVATVRGGLADRRSDAGASADAVEDDATDE